MFLELSFDPTSAHFLTTWDRPQGQNTWRWLVVVLNLVSAAGFHILRFFVQYWQLINESQLCGLELLETVHSQHPDHCKHFHGSEPIVELSKRLLVVQKELGLPYIPELSLPMLFLFFVLVQSELEHEQLPALRLVLFLLKWKNENGIFTLSYLDGSIISLAYYWIDIEWSTWPGKTRQSFRGHSFCSLVL